MNQKELIKYFNRLNEQNKTCEFDDYKRRLLQIKLDTLNIEFKLNNKNYVFHNTSINNLMRILKSKKLLPNAFNSSEMKERFGGLPITATNQESGVMECKIMEFLSGNWVIDDELKTRLQVLKYLINDKKPKTYLLDHLNPLAFYLEQEKSVILGINPETTNVIEKFNYKEIYIQSQKQKEITYWVKENEEKFILDYVKSLAKYNRSEFITYGEIPLHLIECIIVLDNFEISDVINLKQQERND
ncbi:hypothetical protein [Lentibacillus salicampi]|uniref:Uncharacterized protein n=1 Tax=Lentibacillus salicampi TaxID=175306 RepID=A0A4Y9AGZ8_9BACI|nr:hypothetical protein [Lentibacillus salicampi]TFJ93654.1 hypothetical protein E4U82_06770 [Lentibacillus salicampi]